MKEQTLNFTTIEPLDPEARGLDVKTENQKTSPRWLSTWPQMVVITTTSTGSFKHWHWAADKRHGTGTMVWANGSRYEGAANGGDDERPGRDLADRTVRDEAEG